MGPRRLQGVYAHEYYGVLHGRRGRLGGAVGRPRAGSLPGCHKEPVALVSGN